MAGDHALGLTCSYLNLPGPVGGKRHGETAHPSRSLAVEAPARRETKAAIETEGHSMHPAPKAEAPPACALQPIHIDIPIAIQATPAPAIPADTRISDQR